MAVVLSSTSRDGVQWEVSGGPVKRGYSREFTPRSGRRVQLVIDRVPPMLYEVVKAKAKREGVSLRSLVLGLLKHWVTDNRS